MSRRPKQQRPQRMTEIRTLHATTASVRTRDGHKVLARLLTWAFVIGVSVVSALLISQWAVNSVLRETLYENPNYVLKEVQLETKGDFSQRQVRQAAGLTQGVNLMALDLRRVERDIEKLPYVAEARVERRLPDKLVIRIQERMPIARVIDRSGGKESVLYLDADRVLIQPRAGEGVRILPEIVGLRATDLEPGQRLDHSSLTFAIDLLKAIEQTPLRTSLDIRRIDLDQPLAILVYTAQGAEVKFRLEYIEQQLWRLQEILNHAQLEQKQLLTANLAQDRNVPVTWVDLADATAAPPVLQPPSATPRSGSRGNSDVALDRPTRTAPTTRSARASTPAPTSTRTTTRPNR